jgi:hypothetical protein
MVDTETILALLPHYLAMLAIVFLAVTVLRTAFSEVNLIAEFVVIVVLVFLYPFVIRRLGYAPAIWE